MDDNPFREQVFVGNWADAQLVNNLLIVEGIDSIVANDKRGSRQRAVYVLDEAQIGRAGEIVAAYLRREPLKNPKSYRSWRCRSCNELIEGQFEVCWNCGQPRT